MFFRKLILSVAALLASAGAMAQESYFDFSFSGLAGYSGSMVLGGTSVGSGEYLINSVAGSVDGGQAVSLLTSSTIYGSFNGQPIYEAPAAAGYNFIYNDILYTAPGSTSFDLYGLGLTTATGNAINIYSLNGTTLDYLDNGRLISFGGGGAANVPITASITAAVPEPGTYAMLLAGLVAVCFIGVRRSRPAMALAA